MPTYTYQCVKCDYAFDVFHAMSASPKVKCEACGGRCEKQLGVGAGIIFKGSGFYETDYKNKKGKPAESGKTGKNGSDKSTSAKKDGPAASTSTSTATKKD